uniref:Uncharacterized protein n=1 Tax=Panagrolaimus sp. ES5 TaxID=591445 RepID=A0AC34FB20_9BILA
MTNKQVGAVNLDSGSDILFYYNKGHPDAVFKYKQICNVLLSVDSWSEKSKNEFFVQFFGCAHRFLQPTELLVERLCAVSWSSIPQPILFQFVTLLKEIAVTHVYHTKVIIDRFFNGLLPLVDIYAPEVNENSSDAIAVIFQPPITAEQQQVFTNLSREAIIDVIRRLHTSQEAVVEIAFKKFPHYSGPTFKFTEYIKQLILIAECCPDIAQDLWMKIVDHVLQIDAIISKSVASNAKFDAGDSLFALEDENMTIDSPIRQREIHLTNKLDKTMIIILSRI